MNTLTMHAGYLRGVDVIGETSLLVTSQAQTFNWIDYGMKLHIPQGSLPTKLEHCKLHIKVGLSGQFSLPKNTSLVSAVYWVDSEPRCKFSEAITIEIQHCAKPMQSSRLSFVRAKCSQKDLPYTFKTMDGGKFTQQTNFGCISLHEFSILSILRSFFVVEDQQQQTLDEDPYYHASFYYIGKPTSWKVHFVVTAELDAYHAVSGWCKYLSLFECTFGCHYTSTNATYVPVLQAVRKQLNNPILGTSLLFEFEGDHVSLDIPREGMVERNWSIIPLVPLIVSTLFSLVTR